MLNFFFFILLSEYNDLDCTHIQCPTKCPEDSYLKTTMDAEDDEFIDYEDEFISHFEELPPLIEAHEEHPEHSVKERQKREVFFQEDIEKCCDNQKCVCNKCPDVPKCFEGYIAVEIHEGQGVPGNCCSQYRCLKKEKCQLGVKQTWFTGKCTKCSCFGENELCMQNCPEEEIVQNCYNEYLQKPMINGAAWKEGPCTSCTCEQGERRCLASICPKLDCKHTVTYEDICCPQCLDDERDERIEIVHNQEEEEEEVEEANTETIDLAISNELNSTSVSENTSTDTIILSDSSTSTPLMEFDGTTLSGTIEETTSASPKINKESIENTSSTETSGSISTPVASSTEENVSVSSTISSSTISDQTHSEIDSTTNALFGLDIDVTTPRISTTTEGHKSEIELAEDTNTSTSSTTEVTESTTISAMPISSETSEETTTQISLEISSSTNTDFSTASIMTSDVSAIFTSNVTPKETISTDSETSTNAAIESTTLSSTTETYTASTVDKILSSEMPSISSSPTTETPIEATTHISSLLPTFTSTTSSSYSVGLETSSVTQANEVLKESSTTSAPEPLLPLYQLYGDFDSDERISTSTQNQMRSMFDEIDYVLMIGLFVGLLTCIALVLIIRHTKNRKKMYSSVPNSETSLSQTSTVLTV